MTEALLERLGATAEQIDRERDRILQSCSIARKPRADRAVGHFGAARRRANPAAAAGPGSRRGFGAGRAVWRCGRRPDCGSRRHTRG